MPKFKEYFKLNEAGTIYLGYQDRKIIDTSHSVERFLSNQRFKEAGSKELLQEILETIRKGIKLILTKYKDKSNIYLIHSKSTKLGIVIEWRHDKYSSNNINHAIIVTILPKKEKHYTANPNDIFLMVEKKYTDIIKIEI